MGRKCQTAMRLTLTVPLTLVSLVDCSLCDYVKLRLLPVFPLIFRLLSCPIGTEPLRHVNNETLLHSNYNDAIMETIILMTPLTRPYISSIANGMQLSMTNSSSLFLPTVCLISFFLWGALMCQDLFPSFTCFLSASLLSMALARSLRPLSWLSERLNRLSSACRSTWTLLN